jgi:hypothetical protein
MPFLIVLSSLIAFLPVLRNEFVDRDDFTNIIENENCGVVHANLANALADRSDWQGAMKH